MKKLLLISLLCLACSCNVQKINSGFQPYNEHVDFNVKKSYNIFTHEGSSKKTNENYQYFAEKGTRFRRVIFEFKNNSSEKQEIDFSRLFLITEDNHKNKVLQALQLYKPTFKVNELVRTIKAEKTRSFMVLFKYPIPKDEKIRRLLIEDKVLATRDRIIELSPTK